MQHSLRLVVLRSRSGLEQKRAAASAGSSLMARAQLFARRSHAGGPAPARPRRRHALLPSDYAEQRSVSACTPVASRVPRPGRCILTRPHAASPAAPLAPPLATPHAPATSARRPWASRAGAPPEGQGARRGGAQREQGEQREPACMLPAILAEGSAHG